VGGLAPTLAAHADRVLVAEDDALATYSPVVWTGLLEQLVATLAPELVLLPHSYRGLDLAGRLAAALGWPTVTDVAGLAVTPGRLEATRLVYGGRAQARVAAALPAVVSVRPTAFTPGAPRATPGSVESVVVPAAPATGLQVVETLATATGDIDLARAEVVVAVGRGIGDREQLAPAAALAAALGGVLAGSRPLVDRGWLPRERQVGTSGQAVRPRVYLALGISGAFQHVAGMQGAGTVIAVNRDRHAPIFAVADHGIVADLEDVLPALLAAAGAPE
jgi:electron transfer flavoprotein alpha subunit